MLDKLLEFQEVKDNIVADYDALFDEYGYLTRV